jgi:hypothetical protein
MAARSAASATPYTVLRNILEVPSDGGSVVSSLCWMKIYVPSSASNRPPAALTPMGSKP